jgi:hypothetical protein
MADNTDFFKEEEQKAQAEIEKIKLGEAEYDPKELEEMVAKGKKVDEYQKKYNTDFDKAWSSYGKTTQENKALREELEAVKAQRSSNPQPQVTGELTEDQIQMAREQAKKIGIVTQGDLDQWYQTRRSSEKLLDECGNLEGTITGDDGRPKFSTKEILDYMVETGIKNPEKAYKDKYEKELDGWKQAELAKSKGQYMPTLSELGKKTSTPAQIKITKDNIAQMVNEELWGSHGNQE